MLKAQVNTSPGRGLSSGHVLPSYKHRLCDSVTDSKKNAISQCPPQYQARERSPESVQLNIGEREDSSPRSPYEVINEATLMPESDVVTPLCTVLRGMPHSSITNVGASYDVWRSSMTALLDMDAEEFEQMSNGTSDKKNVDHDLYEENQAL